MPFSKLIGNDFAKAVLLRMVTQNRVPPALLFHGPQGVGKGHFALELAQLLMGREHVAKLTAGIHPDLHIFRPEGKSAIHPMENIRKLIDEAALPPYEAPIKVFILHDAHQMLTFSSNALLKTLEEPAPRCYFILLTSFLDAILPTILSRCCQVPFFLIPQSQIETFVKENWQKSPEEARRIAFLSHGSLSRAEWLSAHQQRAWREKLLELLTLHLPDEYPQFLKLVSEIDAEYSHLEEKESSTHPLVEMIFEEIAAWYRDLQLLKEGISTEYLYHLDHLEKLKTALLFPVPPLEKVLDVLSFSRLAVQRHVKLRTVLEHLFLKF